MLNYESHSSTTESSSSSSNYDSTLRFFEETQGEIYINEIECPVYKIDIHPGRKTFTEGFIEGMRDLQKAAKNPNDKTSMYLKRKFIQDWGTHYMSESWLGAKMTAIKYFTSKSRDSSEQTNREKCVGSAFRKSSQSGVRLNDFTVDAGIKKGPASLNIGTKLGGQGMGSGNSFQEESEKCDRKTQGSNFFNLNNFAETETFSVGARPYTDQKDWLKATKEEASVIKTVLTPIADLFKNSVRDLDQIPQDPANPSLGNLNGDVLHRFYLDTVNHYCETMLGEACPPAKEGCAIAGQCGYGRKCVDGPGSPGSSSQLGFHCVDSLSPCQLHGRCRDNERCENDDNTPDGYICKRGCSIYNNCGSSDNCVDDPSEPLGYKCKGNVQHRIHRCESSYIQKYFECERAFDGDTTKYHPQDPSYILGWAYGGHNPAYSIFYLERPVSLNTIIFKTGLNRHDHHLNDFAIDVKVGTAYKPVVVTKVNVAKSKISGNRVQTNGEMNIQVKFKTIDKVSAIKLHAYGSDAYPNQNSVVNELYALFLAGNVQHRIHRCESSYVQKDFECERAFDGDTIKYLPQDPSYILGWAYGGHNPAYSIFYLERPVSLNTIIFMTGLNRHDHHLNDFAIDVQVGTAYKPVVVTKVNVAKSKINGNRVQTNGEMNIQVEFKTMDKVSAIKVHAYGSDAYPNQNSVVNELYALFLSNNIVHFFSNVI